MSKVIAYKNNERLSFCQIKFDSREKVLVSYASSPAPGIKVIKLLFGIIPLQTIWEFGVAAEDGNGHDRLVAMLTDQDRSRANHPLDAAVLKLLSCRSCREAVSALREAELRHK
ncbi:MAG: hypothetical protein HZA17_09150 [Nitrospirae bacterium]|nr:hypothetical protein [Nitrospirota bacterium]